MVFLGLEVDTIEMVIQIPHEKLIRLISLLEPLLWKRRIQLKEFESIVGLMAFCSKALASSRAFLRFYDVLASVKSRNPIFSIKILVKSGKILKYGFIFYKKVMVFATSQGMIG